MTRSGSIALFICLLLAVPGAFAQAVRLDDSGTQVMGSALKLGWAEPIPRPGTAQLMTGTITVNVRLNVRAWMGRNVRIYKVLSPTPGARVRVQWTSQGRLLSGQLREGERTLVYAGPITSEELQDLLQIAVIADGSRIGSREVLKFDFELETVGQ